ncbi:hypothetical protein DET53_101615 [Vibrio parahaemolyticus]|nr:hypothetical protein DET53_101615 [Vibrio parahaemolyticus]
MLFTYQTGMRRNSKNVSLVNFNEALGSKGPARESYFSIPKCKYARSVAILPRGVRCK